MPLPIYFDLRDLDTERPPDLGLRTILDHLLRQAAATTAIDGDGALEIIGSERSLVIFDGLDEVLVHLSESAGQRLVRGLQEVLSLPSQESHDTRLLLTCRSQYFKTVRDELSFFAGQQREWVRGEDYLALTLLLFEEEQILEYLERNVEGADPHRLLETICSVHDLYSLARQPVLLSMIRHVLPRVEEALVEHRRIRTVELYEEFVEQWLSRDDGKHTLTPEHKLWLMGRLAREGWTSGTRTWSAS